MEPQQPQPSQHQAHAHVHAHQRPSHPHLHNILPPPPTHIPIRTANSTPVSSPGLFSPSLSRQNMSLPSTQPGSESTTPGGLNSPYLHPLQSHKVRETHKANVDHDLTTGRKLINSYEIIEELGRGVHGKVKLARNTDTGEFVAIKIIPRFSKKRRLGKVTAMSTQDKSKKEIAILKKIRHPNIVALLEIIDDPELKKIYMVLEHVELGEVVWRKKGLPHICAHERRRIEREQRGEKPTPEEERYEQLLVRRQTERYAKRARQPSQVQNSAVADYWSLEFGNADEDEVEFRNRSLGGEEAGAYAYSPSSSVAASRGTSRAPSRTQSAKSLSGVATPLPAEADFGAAISEEELETPGPLRDGMMYGAYPEDPALRGRSPSMAESVVSHMSSVDYNKVHDPFVDDYSYVPCFTMEQARQTFRDTVLGLEYLHYEGVVHRDIKPANLLWTRDHRVKISDFGVSYFGRPVRDGEPDETISESEARDFDNDLELAKTVGTPAFFAPELCYTDAYDDKPGAAQPKVTEQIDVWSLGVTLYCLIFARIPFLAEDEWQMFRKIATEEVYIPKQRLRPVDPATRPLEGSLYTRVNRDPYRDDDELSYEDIDEDLQDLLSKMLIKNPEKRIRLRDVKRHRWVLHGIDNVIQWLDETDPSRRTSGRKIQVDDREVAHAVVPLTFFERARSAVKKTFNKVLHHRQERAESVASRKRADSNATNSAGDSPAPNGLITPHLRDSRRRSIRPDDYFASGSQQQTSEHPLTHSVLASPHDESPVGSRHSASQQQQQQHQQPSSTAIQPRQLLELVTNLTNSREDFWQTSSASPYRSLPRHGGHVTSRSMTNAFLTLTPGPSEIHTTPTTPYMDIANADPSNALRKARDMRPITDDLGRARSVDRGLFTSTDKRAEPKVSLSTAIAPGNVHFSQRPFAPRAVVELASSPVMTGYQHTHPKSDPSIHRQRAPVELDERPMTAHRIEEFPEVKTPQQRPRRPSLYDPSPRTQVVDTRPKRHLTDVTFETEPALIPCPPSPDDDDSFHPLPLSRGETIATAKSSSSTSIGALTTPLTSPSESASPIYAINTNLAKDATERMLAFQSDPSLPALLSSTSSVSADFEGEFLGNPGIVERSSVIDTTDNITPSGMAKEPSSGFPLDVDLDRNDCFSLALDERARPASALEALRGRRMSRSQVEEDNDDDSDSDDGLLIMSSKKKKHHAPRETHSMGRLSVHTARRRDTNASIGSTETAKKIVVDSD